MKTTETFSKNLVRFRKAQGLSLRELSALTGISYTLIFHYENQPKSIPINKLEKLANALDVQVTDFFHNNGEGHPLDNLDVRWIKKINEIKKLKDSFKKEISRHISYLIESSKQEKDIS